MGLGNGDDDGSGDEVFLVENTNGPVFTSITAPARRAKESRNHSRSLVPFVVFTRAFDVVDPPKQAFGCLAGGGNRESDCELRVVLLRMLETD